LGIRYKEKKKETKNLILTEEKGHNQLHYCSLEIGKMGTRGEELENLVN